MMEVIDATSHFTVANTTNRRDPAFTVTGLRPGTGYIVAVHSFNGKGRSKEMRVHAFTLKGGVAGHLGGGAANGRGLREDTPKTGESSLTRMGEFHVTPILAVLLVVGSALILVFLVITVYFCVHGRGSRKRGGAAARASGAPLTPRGTSVGGVAGKKCFTTETHIPLNTGIDDCIKGDGYIEGGTTTRTTTINNFSSREDIGNPDLIPIQARASGKFFYSKKSSVISLFVVLTNWYNNIRFSLIALVFGFLDFPGFLEFSFSHIMTR
jgi:hypothetical protein